MPRYDVPKSLVRDNAAAERDARLFDTLCDIAIKAARPVMKSALVRRFSESGAEALSEEVLALLFDVLVDSETPIEDEVREKIRKELSRRVSEPDDELVEEQARQLGQVYISSWLDAVLATRKSFGKVMLGRDLLPGRVSESAPLQGWEDAIEQFDLSRTEVKQLTRQVRDELISRRTIDLPFGMTLDTSEVEEIPEPLITVRDRRSHAILESVLVDVAFQDQQVIANRNCWVTPRSVERVIRSIEGVENAALIGSKRDPRNASLVLFITMEPDSGIDEKEVLRQCNQLLKPHERPQIVKTLSVLPRRDDGIINVAALMTQVTGRSKG